MEDDLERLEHEARELRTASRGDDQERDAVALARHIALAWGLRLQSHSRGGPRRSRASSAIRGGSKSVTRLPVPSALLNSNLGLNSKEQTFPLLSSLNAILRVLAMPYY